MNRMKDCAFAGVLLASLAVLLWVQLLFSLANTRVPGNPEQADNAVLSVKYNVSAEKPPYYVQLREPFEKGTCEQVQAALARGGSGPIGRGFVKELHLALDSAPSPRNSTMVAGWYAVKKANNETEISTFQNSAAKELKHMRMLAEEPTVLRPIGRGSFCNGTLLAVEGPHLAWDVAAKIVRNYGATCTSIALLVDVAATLAALERKGMLACDMKPDQLTVSITGTRFETRLVDLKSLWLHEPGQRVKGGESCAVDMDCKVGCFAWHFKKPVDHPVHKLVRNATHCDVISKTCRGYDESLVLAVTLDLLLPMLGPLHWDVRKIVEEVHRNTSAGKQGMALYLREQLEAARNYTCEASEHQEILPEAQKALEERIRTGAERCASKPYC